MHLLAGLGRAWASRFIEVQGIDRAMALAAQAFSALIPLLIVVTALVPRDDELDFADGVIEQFELAGPAAASFREAFSSTASVQEGISLFGVVLTLVSALAFSRGLQRLYEGAYRLPSRGIRGSGSGLAWLGLLAAYTGLRPVVAGLFETATPQLVVSVALATLVWTATPYVLLGQRLALRTLLPGALMAATGLVVLVIGSAIWLPQAISSAAEQFGLIGVGFALLSWLVVAGVVLVAAATGGAVAAERWLQAPQALEGRPGPP
jgi:membrane protein